MMIERVHIEYTEISEDESDELLRQVYDLLLSDSGDDILTSFICAK